MARWMASQTETMSKRKAWFESGAERPEPNDNTLSDPPIPDLPTPTAGSGSSAPAARPVPISVAHSPHLNTNTNTNDNISNRPIARIPTSTTRLSSTSTTPRPPPLRVPSRSRSGSVQDNEDVTRGLDGNEDSGGGSDTWKEASLSTTINKKRRASTTGSDDSTSTVKAAASASASTSTFAPRTHDLPETADGVKNKKQKSDQTRSKPPEKNQAVEILITRYDTAELDLDPDLPYYSVEVGLYDILTTGIIPKANACFACPTKGFMTENQSQILYPTIARRLPLLTRVTRLAQSFTTPLIELATGDPDKYMWTEPNGQKQIRLPPYVYSQVFLLLHVVSR